MSVLHAILCMWSCGLLRTSDSYGVTLFCPPGTHNDIATVFFDEHTISIKHIFGMEMENTTQHNTLGAPHAGNLAAHVEPPITNRCLLIVCVAYMTLMVLCVGVSVPAGMFMPSIMVRCCCFVCQLGATFTPLYFSPGGCHIWSMVWQRLPAVAWGHMATPECVCCSRRNRSTVWTVSVSHLLGTGLE